MPEKEPVALTRCFFCGGPGDILIHKHLGDISQLHNKVVNDQPCSKCAEHMKIGIILISVRDGEGQTEESRKNPYRTGKMSVMREEAARRLFQPQSDVLRKRCAFIEDSVWKQLGLPEGNEDYTDPRIDHGYIKAVCKQCQTQRSVDMAWSEGENGCEIMARCLTCNPADNQEDPETWNLVPHILKKW